MTSYDPPTAEQIASLVDDDESDQLSGKEDTSDGEETGESADGKTNEGDDKADDGGEAKGSDGDEAKSDDGEDGSNGKDSDGEAAGKGDDAGAGAITLGDKEYTAEELTLIVKDHANNENWTKTNTENAQENSAAADRIKEGLAFLEKLAADPDALELLQDVTGIKLDDKALESIKAIQDMAGSEDGAPSDIDVLRAENAILQWRQQHMDEFADQAGWDKFMEFATEHREPSIDKAHILWKAQGSEERLKAAEEET
ncbi:hypothetical protein LCGC14_2529940, partial [marine sediment metagenome]